MLILSLKFKINHEYVYRTLFPKITDILLFIVINNKGKYVTAKGSE